MTSKISISSKLNGLGDSLCSMWCVEGLKQAGMDVDFFVRPEHIGICRLYHERVFHKDNAPLDAVTLNISKTETEMAGRPPDNLSRIDWWWGWAEEQYSGEFPAGATPKKPQLLNPFVLRPELENTIVIAPECCFYNRTWNMGHYGRLVHLLKEAGHEVVAFVEKAESKVNEINGLVYHYGMSFEGLAMAIASSKLLIGNDSGPAHIAGTVGTPCIPVHAVMPPEAVWNYYSDFFPAYPDDACAGCGFKADRGYHPHTCGKMCSALEGISAGDVFKIAEQALTQIN